MVATQGVMLVTRVGGIACALPIEHVVETMRPLPVEPIGKSPDEALASVEGLAMIRGAPVPVVDARRLLGVTGAHTARFVIVRSAERRIALVVDAVLDVRRIELDRFSRLPPLLGSANRGISAIGACDAGLLVVLESARVLSEHTWRAIEQGSDRATSDEAHE
jgi:purine-binding chemotaxis protein CheW